MATANSATRFTTEGFANDNSDFEGLTDYSNFAWVLKLARAEVAMWRRVALIQKAESRRPIQGAR